MMDMPTTISIFAIAIAVIVAVLVVAERRHVAGETFTLADAGEIVQGAEDLAPKIRDVAFEVVGGMQQLRDTGKIDTGSEAFAQASEHLQAWFPDIDPKLLTPFIENAYRIIKLRSAPATAPKTDGQRLADWTAQELAAGSSESPIPL